MTISITRRGIAATALGALVLVMVTACGSTHSTTTARPPSTVGSVADVAAWWTSGTVARDWRALGADASSLSSAEQAADSQSITTACTALKADATGFQPHLPAPDAVLNRHMTTATLLMIQAADACLADDFIHSDVLAEQAAGEVNAVAARVSEITAGG